MGNLSLSRKSFKPESKYKIAIGSSIEKEIEIMIHVSSYEYRTAGILKSIDFGTFESIINESNRERAIHALIISVCLVLGLYFFVTLNQKNLVYVIEQMGLNTLLAHNGKETLDIIEKNEVDLIILDFMLPDISGDKLCKKFVKNTLCQNFLLLY